MPRPVPEAAVEAAVEGISANYRPSWAKDWRASIERDARAAVEAAMPVIIREVAKALGEEEAQLALGDCLPAAQFVKETFLDD